MSKPKKRHILTAALAVAMASAIFVNWYYNKEDVKKEETTAVSGENLGDSVYVNGTVKDENSDDEVQDVSKKLEYFAEAELKRTQTHDKALDEIQKLLDGNGKDEDIEKLLDDYTKNLKLEADIENLINAKIDSQCLVIVNGDSAEIVVDSDAIDELYLLQITDIVQSQTKIPAEKIVIIQAK